MVFTEGTSFFGVVSRIGEHAKGSITVSNTFRKAPIEF